MGLGQTALSEGAVYWIETRPEEGGRGVIVYRAEDGKIKEVNSFPYNARTRVHEYGGGAFLVAGDSVFFSNFEDQRVYQQQSDAVAQPITPEGDYRYADAIFDCRRN